MASPNHGTMHGIAQSRDDAWHRPYLKLEDTPMKARLSIGVFVLSILSALAVWVWWQHNHHGLTPAQFSLPGDCQICSQQKPVEVMTPGSVPTQQPQDGKQPNDFFPMFNKHSFAKQPY
jgi:hypothetical protein